MNVRTDPRASAARGRLPLAVYLLAFSLFAMGSAEFLVAGVLPAIADDLRITLPAAGAMISAFAVGVVVGGPLLAVATLRWPRRITLVTAQVVFAASVAAGLLTDRRRPDQRRRTSLSADQVASTAHTFTSTQPWGSAWSRTRSSVRSVVTPDAFFGHATQTAPRSVLRPTAGSQRLRRAAASAQNTSCTS
jgi:hypothetical protein